MPKRKQSDGFDVLSDVFAVLPWWVPVLLAILVWFVLPHLGPSIAGGTRWEPTWRVVTYVAVFAIVLTGISGQFAKARRRQLVTQAKSLEGLQALSWRQFEQLCAEAYRRQGYAVEETACGADGGIDLVLRRKRERIFVQCKHYAVRRVDVRPVRELFGVMAAEGATGGILICSGSYTSTAEQFARGKNLDLVDGPQLLKLLQPAGAAR